jgi:mannose-6-phosphate isomerase-like protein (cupin superfamily)
MKRFDTKMGQAQNHLLVLGEELRAVVLTTGEETGGRHDLTLCEQPAGGMTPLHLHSRYEERFWVVAGSMTVWAGSEKACLTPGHFYVVPMNVPHAIQAGPDGVRALNISSPAGFGELIARTGVPAEQPAAEAAFDPNRFAAVSEELGDVVLGPPGAIPGSEPYEVAGVSFEVKD